MPFVLIQKEAPFHYLKTKGWWNIKTTPNIGEAKVFRQKNHATLANKGIEDIIENNKKHGYGSKKGYESSFQIIPVKIEISAENL